MDVTGERTLGGALRPRFYHRGLAALLIALAASLDVAGTAQAQHAPPAAPILRVRITDAHRAGAQARRTTRRAIECFTASDDKTVRVWQLPKGRLVRVLRAPIAEGFEGRLYVADMHPTGGRSPRAAGPDGISMVRPRYTSSMSNRREHVRRIGGFAETIGTLAFSPDGAHLAVGLHGGKGLRMLRTSDYAEVARDTDYGDRILELGFAPDGRLVVASLDGYIRLYDQRFQLIGRRKTSTAQQPLSIKFSPNGSYIAVGFSDSAPPAIYRASRPHLVGFRRRLGRSAISGACRTSSGATAAMRSTPPVSRPAPEPAVSIDGAKRAAAPPRSSRSRATSRQLVAAERAEWRSLSEDPSIGDCSSQRARFGFSCAPTSPTCARIPPRSARVGCCDRRVPRSTRPGAPLPLLVPRSKLGACRRAL